MPELSPTLSQATASVSQALQVEEQKARKLAQWMQQSQEALTSLSAQRDRLVRECEELEKRKTGLADELEVAQEAHVAACRVHTETLERRASQLDGSAASIEARLREAELKEQRAGEEMGKFLDAKAVAVESFRKVVSQLQHAVDQLAS